METTETPAITVRKVSFEGSLADLPKHFAGDNLIISHFVAALSAVFPEGEEFFVRSVRHYRNQITDPILKKEINLFMGQEMVHGREHRVFNNRLDELGYPMKRIDKSVKDGLARADVKNTPEVNLAITAALEHFTSCMGKLMLDGDSLSSLIEHEEVRAMLLWHALEETEHKAVAFDVYRAVGGSEKVRRKVMNRITYGFISSTMIRVVMSMMRDRAAYNPVTVVRSLRDMAKSPLFRRSVWRDLRDYNRPGFHPNDHDTTELLERSREALFGVEGSLNDKLVVA